jgi:hypothetical protein
MVGLCVAYVMVAVVWFAIACIYFWLEISEPGARKRALAIMLTPLWPIVALIFVCFLGSLVYRALLYGDE